MGGKSDKGDGKYANRKFATFGFQLRYQKAKTDSEIAVKKHKEKVWGAGEHLSQELDMVCGHREQHAQQDCPTRIAAHENFSTYCKGLASTWLQ